MASTASRISAAVKPRWAASSARGVTWRRETSGDASTRTSWAPLSPRMPDTISVAIRRSSSRSSPYTAAVTSVIAPPSSSLKRIWIGCVNESSTARSLAVMASSRFRIS